MLQLKADSNKFLFVGLSHTHKGPFFSYPTNPAMSQPHVPMLLACGGTNPICQICYGNKTRGTLRMLSRIELECVKDKLLTFLYITKSLCSYIRCQYCTREVGRTMFQRSTELFLFCSDMNHLRGAMQR